MHTNDFIGQIYSTSHKVERHRQTANKESKFQESPLLFQRYVRTTNSSYYMSTTNQTITPPKIDIKAVPRDIGRSADRGADPWNAGPVYDGDAEVEVPD
jgi:hypothetical protein